MMTPQQRKARQYAVSTINLIFDCYPNVTIDFKLEDRPVGGGQFPAGAVNVGISLTVRGSV